MRLVTAFAALIAAALLAGCGGVSLPAPNPTGDTAVVAALKKACTSAAPLTAIKVAAGPVAVAAAASADNTTVLALQSRLLKLTPTISNSSPLAPTLTRLAEFMLDTSRRYQGIVIAEQDLATVSAKLAKHYTRALAAEKARDTSELAGWPQLALVRAGQAQGKLTELGITSCLR